jgi:pyrroline-5-carboxylate reductase
MSSPIIAFIGSGNMATSLIGGLINQGFPAANIIACDPSEEQREKLRTNVPQGDHLKCYPDAEQANTADIIVLAVKPQILKSVALDLAQRLKPEAMVVSIAAGISMHSLQDWFGQRAIVRCMPNTPSLIQKGATGLYANDQTTPDQKQRAEDILSTVGIVQWVDSDGAIDIVTAISGSGPAYFFYFMELMTQSAVDMGLPQDVAEKLAIQTCLGAGTLASESPDRLGELRAKVTSKGGTTHAALESFKRDNLKQTIDNAMRDCARRAAEMAKEFGE